MRDIQKKDFWITNVSKKNVCLADLALTVPAGASMNLLDSRHFNYSLEQLKKSSSEGSIFKKNNMIRVRNIPPETEVIPDILVSNQIMQKSRDGKHRSTVKIVEKRYEELNVSDEKFAEQFSAGMEEPSKPLTSSKKK